MRFAPVLLSLLGVNPMWTIPNVRADQGTCKAMTDGTPEDLNDCCSGQLPRTAVVDWNVIEYHCGETFERGVRISRLIMGSAKDCASLLAGGRRAQTAVWKPRTKECFYSAVENPAMRPDPGTLVMKYKGQEEQTDCTAKVKEVEGRCQNEKDAQAAQCESDKTGLVNRCDQEKDALSKRCEDEKAASAKRCEDEKGAISKRCEDEKQALKNRCDDEKGALSRRCEDEKQALKKTCDDEKGALLKRCEDEKQALTNKCDDEKDALVRRCETEKGELKKECEEEKKVINNNLIQCNDEKDKISELLTRCEKNSREVSWEEDLVMNGKRIRAVAMAYSPVNGQQVAIGDVNGNVDVYDIQTGAKTALGTTGTGSGYPTSIAWSRDGTRVLCGTFQGTVKMWEIASNTEVTFLQENKPIMRTQVAISPDRTIVAAGLEDGRVLMWNADTRQPISTTQRHSSAVTGLVFSLKDGRLVSGSLDKTLKFWRVGNDVQTHTLDAGITSLAVSPDGASIACGLQDSSIRIWNGDISAQRRDLRAHTGPVTGVAFSFDGRQLASSSEDGSFRIWSLTNDYVLAARPSRKGRAVAFSSDGASLATMSELTPLEFWKRSAI